MNLIQPALGRGNIKVGPIPTFSLPSRFTCPGATSWCLSHCYAWRFERIWPNCRTAYARNLVLSWNTRRFVRAMLDRISEDLPALRIHVSGDFYSEPYALAVWHIAAKRPLTRFWGYSRSWTIPTLLPALERVRALSNFQLFASVDPNMPDPPAGWRVAYLEIDPRANGLPCLHQYGSAASCFECRYCLRPGKGNVVFKVH
jgi:hypothetical protein